MKFLLLVFIYEAHGFASESSVWVLFSYTVTHTTQQSWNDTTTCRTLTIFIFKNVYFLTHSVRCEWSDFQRWLFEVNNENQFLPGSLRHFSFFFFLSLFFFLFRSYMIGQLHDVWWRLSVRTKQSLACTEQKGRRGGYRHTTRSFPSLVLLCTCKWERVRTSDTKKTFWKLEKMTDDSKISIPWERILSKKGQSKTERINGINRLKLRDSAFLMLDFILW